MKSLLRIRKETEMNLRQTEDPLAEPAQIS
jgi:hypothetical protein